jgi:hypothetical protein
MSRDILTPMDYARTSAVLERTEALRKECGRLRLQAVSRRRESRELRSACQKAGQECCLSIERTKSRCQPQMTSESRPEHLASVIAHVFSNLAIPAFVVKPSRDTALTS